MQHHHTQLEQLRTLCNGDVERMKRYITMFLQGTPQVLEQMRADQVAGQLESLARNAHGLKPQAAYMGATMLKEQLQRLEQLGREGDLQGSASALEDCVRTHAAVMDELKALLDQR